MSEVTMKKKNPLENRHKYLDIEWNQWQTDKTLRSTSWFYIDRRSHINYRSLGSLTPLLLGVPPRQISFRICRTTRNDK